MILVDPQSPHAATLGIRRHTQGHAITDPRFDAVADARGCQVPPYDGVAEIYWNSVEDMIAAGTSAEGQEAGAALLEDEQRYIDLPNSSLFFVRDHEILAGRASRRPTARHRRGATSVESSFQH